jgi:hypothetical protein
MATAAEEEIDQIGQTLGDIPNPPSNTFTNVCNPLANALQEGAEGTAFEIGGVSSNGARQTGEQKKVVSTHYARIAMKVWWRSRKTSMNDFSKGNRKDRKKMTGCWQPKLINDRLIKKTISNNKNERQVPMNEDQLEAIDEGLMFGKRRSSPGFIYP